MGLPHFSVDFEPIGLAYQQIKRVQMVDRVGFMIILMLNKTVLKFVLYKGKMCIQIVEM